MNIVGTHLGNISRPVIKIIFYVWILVLKNEAKVYFEISDNGPGIEKEQASNIFQLFSSSKGNRGTGIGFLVPRKAILKHDGVFEILPPDLKSNPPGPPTRHDILKDSRTFPMAQPFCMPRDRQESPGFQSRPNWPRF